LHGLAAPATLTLWAVATAWIPILISAEVWTVRQRPSSLHYQRAWWATVFPLGMYDVATTGVATQLGISSLATVSLAAFWVALLAWAAVLALSR
jgi:tellurite resistance protein TehA-like permease